MTVGELLAKASSRELTEWRVYEEQEGILSPTYEREVLREIHLMQQRQLHTFIGSKTEKGKENPCPDPAKIPGPADWQDSENDE